MTVQYVCSMDQYGPSGGTVDDNGAATSFFLLDNDIMIGDTFVNLPQPTGAGNRWPLSGLLEIKAPSWGARRGDYALVADQMELANNGGGSSGVASQVSRTGEWGTRQAIPGATDVDRWLHFAFGISALPTCLGQGHILDFMDQNGDIRATLRVNASGRLELTDGTLLRAAAQDSDYSQKPTVLLTTASPVISANTWYSINLKITTNPTDETINFVLYIGDITPANLVMNGSGLAATDTDGAQPAGVANNIDIFGWLPASFTLLGQGVVDPCERAVRDIVIYDDTGTYNNTYLGQVFCAAQEMRAEDAGGGWEAQAREKLGDGVLNHQTASTGVRIGDNANIELGSGDFTIEGFWRFDTLPTTGTVVLASKWQQNDNNRSWKLVWDGDQDELQFLISTDGIAETELFAYPWVPDVDKWYFISVDRDTAVTRVFINGEQLGVDRADANTYFNGTANFGLMSEWNSGNTLVTGTVLAGFCDEFRLTVGLARHTADYSVPTAKFGRVVGDDPNIANVEILMGFDGGVIADESSNAFTVTVGAGVTADQPADGDNSYDVLNRRPSWDDTYIEARNTFATGILTLTANPSDTETITVGSITYTYKTALSAGPTVANEILIGADAAESIDHTIKAINGGSGIGTEYSTGTVANTAVTATLLPYDQMQLTAVTIGATGNSVATTETLANGSFGATTLEGGEDIPSPSDFAIERLPIDVTGVLAMQVTARGFKSDAGSAQLRFDLKGPSAGVDTGTALATDLNPSWLRQIFEEDPDTSATITPSTLTGGRIRVTRTA